LQQGVDGEEHRPAEVFGRDQGEGDEQPEHRGEPPAAPKGDCGEGGGAGRAAEGDGEAGAGVRFEQAVPGDHARGGEERQPASQTGDFGEELPGPGSGLPGGKWLGGAADLQAQVFRGDDEDSAT
ncbi:hypothetical protein HWI79_3572, partial [Cryptosporidium felis]